MGVHGDLSPIEKGIVFSHLLSLRFFLSIEIDRFRPGRSRHPFAFKNLGRYPLSLYPLSPLVAVTEMAVKAQPTTEELCVGVTEERV